MFDVAIIGAGELGGTLVSTVASLDIVRSVHLIDESGGVAAGKALDIAQSAPVLNFATRVTGGTDITSAAGARAIVIADRAVGGDPSTDESLKLLKRLSFGARNSVIVCAGAHQREAVEQAVRTVGLARSRVLGTAPEAMAGALRAMVALEVNGSPADVALTVLGVPPRNLVVPWEDVTIGGIAATRVLDEPARRRLSTLVNRLWPPGPIALANAAAAALRVIFGGSRRNVSAFVAPDDGQGVRTRAVALPVSLGQDGLISAAAPRLTGRDLVELEKGMLL